MTEQLSFLTAKLGVRAPATRCIPRQRLRDLLDNSAPSRLILVSAPAGFGKSTLLAEWLTVAKTRHAWLSLDAADNDIVRFSRYLAATTGQLTDQADDGTRFAPAQSFDAELALARVLDCIAAAANSSAAGVVLVLDDYHVISEPRVHRLVASLIERLPSRARLAVATRADPPFPFARLRARGELLEIRAEDLRFTPLEAAELLRSAGVDLASSEVETLVDRTEGWAAVLRLAAVSLRSRPDHAELVRRFGASHRFVLDYVVEEVLASLPPDVEDFLLRTSILERLSGQLCDAVRGTDDSQARLEDLERANLLIIPLDDERRWYRYHALFAEVLRNRLALAHPDDVTELHRRASLWHEDRGDLDEAIRYGLRSGDVERVSRIVGQASLKRLDDGELSTVRGWLDALPPETVRASAQLSASYAWCLLLSGETAGVCERLADIEHSLDGLEHGPLIQAMLPAELALLRSRLAELEGDQTTAIEQATLARALVPAELPDGTSNKPWAVRPARVKAILRGDASSMLGSALWRAGDVEAAARALEAALPDLRAGGNPLGVANTVANLARIDVESRDPRRALRRCEAHLEDNEDSAGTADGVVWTAMAEALMELGQWERSEAAARRGLELVTRGGDAASARAAEELLGRIGRRLLAHGRSPSGGSASGPGAIERLTPREIEVLRLVALGRSNRQIAAELFVTLGTVKSHLNSISGKLGAANRVEAVARGRESGVLG